MLFTVTAWDSNCPQHIPQRFEAADVAAALAERDTTIEKLKAEIAALRSGVPTPRARRVAPLSCCRASPTAS